MLNIPEKAYIVKPTENASLKPLNRLPSQFIWTGESSVAFKHELATPETQELINNFLHCNYERSETGIDQAVADFQEILLRVAKRSLKRKVAKRRNHISNPTNKKWFDKNCRIKRHAVRKLANLKRRDPTNSDIRTSYHETLSEYKQLLKKKRENYKMIS